MLNLANPDKLAQDIKAYKTQKDEYDRSHKEWLKGRNVVQLEKEAKAKLEAAKSEHQRLLNDIASRQKTLEAKQSSVDAIEQELRSKLMSADQTLTEANQDRVRAKQVLNEASAVRAQAEQELKEAQAMKEECDKLKAKISEFAKTL